MATEVTEPPARPLGRNQTGCATGSSGFFLCVLGDSVVNGMKEPQRHRDHRATPEESGKKNKNPRICFTEKGHMASFQERLKHSLFSSDRAILSSGSSVFSVAGALSSAKVVSIFIRGDREADGGRILLSVPNPARNGGSSPRESRPRMARMGTDSGPKALAGTGTPASIRARGMGKRRGGWTRAWEAMSPIRDNHDTRRA
jgi:hypothetical protein